MQHERQRFLIALSGIAGCLVIAAGILFSTPAMFVVDAPSPRLPAIAVQSPLARLPLPAVAAEPSPTVSSRPRPARVPMAHVTAAPRVTVAASPVGDDRVVDLRIPEVALPPATLPAGARPIPVAGLPQTSGRAVADVGAEPVDRGPVTAAFVTAGTHVGQGFRTVGRTLKNLF